MSRLAPIDVAELEAAVASGVTLLRCSHCKREEPVGDPVKRAVAGWPACCSEEMRLGVPREFHASFDPRDAR